MGDFLAHGPFCDAGIVCQKPVRDLMFRWFCRDRMVDLLGTSTATIGVPSDGECGSCNTILN
jgi:hypothetical protein